MVPTENCAVGVTGFCGQRCASIPRLHHEDLTPVELEHRDLIVGSLQVMEDFEREQEHERKQLKFLQKNPDAHTMWSAVGKDSEEAEVMRQRQIYQQE